MKGRPTPARVILVCFAFFIFPGAKKKFRIRSVVFLFFFFHIKQFICDEEDSSFEGTSFGNGVVTVFFDLRNGAFASMGR